jgi:hypothetical protein
MTFQETPTIARCASRRRPWLRLATALFLLATAGTAVARAAKPQLRRIGNIAYEAVVRQMPAPNPAPPVAKINFRDFTYQLFPTQDTPDPSHAGVPPAATAGQPLTLPVRHGRFDDPENTSAPVEFDIIRVNLAVLPHAPDHHQMVVFGILYAGQDHPVCTGVVQTFETYHHRLWLMDQFTYSCQGGMNARYLPHQRQLRIRSSVAAPGDPPCCPSLQDAVNFKMDGRRVAASGINLAPGTAY